MTGYKRAITDGDPPGAHANSGGMQESRMELPMLAQPATTDGGNHTLTNGRECDTLDNGIEATPFRSGPLSMEDDSHVQAAWAMQTADFAGS